MSRTVAVGRCRNTGNNRTVVGAGCWVLGSGYWELGAGVSNGGLGPSAFSSADPCFLPG